MILCFTLSMPGVNSWNGRWSGEDRYYAAIRYLGKTQKAIKKAIEIESHGYYHYNFGDGWRAGIDVRAVDSKEAEKIRRKSNGFCGYDWMIDSIINHGRILNKLEEKELERPATLCHDKGYDGIKAVELLPLALDALQLLHDYAAPQVGKHKAEWEKAIAKARAVLERAKGGP